MNDLSAISVLDIYVVPTKDSVRLGLSDVVINITVIRDMTQ